METIENMNVSSDSTFKERAAGSIGIGIQRIATVLDRRVTKNSSFSWGLVILLLVAIYAVYNLVRVILYFFG